MLIERLQRITGARLILAEANFRNADRLPVPWRRRFSRPMTGGLSLVLGDDY